LCGALGFHDLRQTAITHLIRSGADVAQVQRFAGHAKPSITLDLYVGEFEKRKSTTPGLDSQRSTEAFSRVIRPHEERAPRKGRSLFLEWLGCG